MGRIPEHATPTAAGGLPPAAASAVWSLPPGSSGKPYCQRVEVADADGRAIATIEGLEGSGLHFDAESQQISGTPTAGRAQAQTLRLLARRHAAAGESADACHTLTLELLLNADPRAMWKTLEPDESLPFRKPHHDAQVLQAVGGRVTAASVRGRSHAHAGSFREDDFRLARADAWTLLAVADGAGSAKLSRRGSQLACDHAVAALVAQIPALESAFAVSAAGETPPALRGQCVAALGRAAQQASQALVDEATAAGEQEKDYASTLLLAAVRPHAAGFFAASYWIGDGALALFRPERCTGPLSQPLSHVPWERGAQVQGSAPCSPLPPQVGEGLGERASLSPEQDRIFESSVGPQTAAVRLLGASDGGEFSGQTRFLLAAEFEHAPDAKPAISERIHCAWAAPDEVLLLMSDGVSDPRFGTDNALKDPARWQALWRDDLAPLLAAPDDATLQNALVDWLGFWSPGEHDDRTLAVWQALPQEAAR